MRQFLLILTLVLTFMSAKAQEKGEGSGTRFYAETSEKEVLLGNSLNVTFRLENGQGGTFIPPNWSESGFDVFGSNQSTSMSFVNGRSSTSAIYNFTVAPRDTGTLTIPQAEIRNGKSAIQTEPLTIRVLPNPDGTVASPRTLRTDPPAYPAMPDKPVPLKKKIKTTRI
jgi:hypothetical protein